MTARRNRIDEATRRALQQTRQAVDDGRHARLARGLSHAQVAAALGCSRQLIGALEGGHLEGIGVLQFARYCAAVGLDVPIRTFAAVSPLRDAGQLRLLERLRMAIGDAWTWRTEVPVTTDPREQRAIDALIVRPPHQVGVEAMTRLIDAQGQVRPIILKEQAASISCMLLLVADTRLHRRAIDDGAATLRPAFPMGAKALLAELRAGRQPASNGLVLL